MTIQDWLVTAQAALQESGIATARLDSLVLLEAALGRDRAQLLAHPEDMMPVTALADLADQLERRLQHEPLAYILGYAEFYGRRFTVTPDVLVPRPESESIITVLKHLLPLTGLPLANTKIADIGTGSGCLAITAVLETGVVACAVDIDEAALAVCKSNAVLHTAPVLALQGDLLAPILTNSAADFGLPHVLLANLPYVPPEYPINDAARHEPALALFGTDNAVGPDGLALFLTMFAQTTQLSTPPQLIITESLPGQHAALTEIAAQASYRLVETEGLVQAFALATTL